MLENVFELFKNELKTSWKKLFGIILFATIINCIVGIEMKEKIIGIGKIGILFLLLNPKLNLKNICVLVLTSLFGNFVTGITLFFSIGVLLDKREKSIRKAEGFFNIKNLRSKYSIIELLLFGSSGVYFYSVAKMICAYITHSYLNNLSVFIVLLVFVGITVFIKSICISEIKSELLIDLGKDEKKVNKKILMANTMNMAISLVIIVIGVVLSLVGMTFKSKGYYGIFILLMSVNLFWGIFIIGVWSYFSLYLAKIILNIQNIRQDYKISFKDVGKSFAMTLLQGIGGIIGIFFLIKCYNMEELIIEYKKYHSIIGVIFYFIYILTLSFWIWTPFSIILKKRIFSSNWLLLKESIKRKNILCIYIVYFFCLILSLNSGYESILFSTLGVVYYTYLYYVFSKFYIKKIGINSEKDSIEK